MTYKLKQAWGLGFLVLLALIYLTVFIWGAKDTDGTVTEIYFADRMTPAHMTLIDRYNKLNEGRVKVVPIDFPNYDFSTDERKEVLARALRGRGDGIDLFAVDLVWVQRFAKWSEPVDKYFTKQEQNKFLDIALESCYYEGELVAIPFDLVQGVMYYREDLVNKYIKSPKVIQEINNGVTWERFIEINSGIKAENPKYIFPASDFEGLICCFVELVTSQDPDYFERMGFNFDNDEARKSLQLMVDLVHKYKLTPRIVTNLTEVSSYEYYMNHDGLFIHGWTTYGEDFEGVDFHKGEDATLKKVPVPYFKGGQPASILGGWNLMVSKFSNKKKETIDFVKFLLTEQSQEIFFKEGGYYPVVKEFYEKEDLEERYPDLNQFDKFIRTVVHRPAHVEYTKYSQIISLYLKKAIQKEISVEDALKKATEAIKNDRITFLDE